MTLDKFLDSQSEVARQYAEETEARVAAENLDALKRLREAFPGWPPFVEMAEQEKLNTPARGPLKFTKEDLEQYYRDMEEWDEADRVAGEVAKLMAAVIGRPAEEVSGMTLGEWQEKVRRMQ